MRTRLESLVGQEDRILRSLNRHSRPKFILVRKKNILHILQRLKRLKMLRKDHLPRGDLNLVMCKNQGERLCLLKCKLQFKTSKIMIQDATTKAIHALKK